jgi:DNA ligase (NAD+)
VSVELEKRPAHTRAWRPPTHCPACATPALRVADEAALRCPNPSCPGRLKALVFYFTRRTGMDVDHLGSSLIEQLVDAKLIADVADVFALPAHAEALLTLPRMGEKSRDNLLTSIARAKHERTFAQLLTALGVPLLGSVAARLVAERYGDLRRLLDLPIEQLRSELAEIHGIGPKLIDSLCSYVADPAQRGVLEKLLRLGVVAHQPERAPRVADGPVSGKSFCVTGVLSRPRAAIHSAIEAGGGELHDRVKKGTTYLVAGDKVGDTKLKAAKKHGALVITETELDALLAG